MTSKFETLTADFLGGGSWPSAPADSDSDPGDIEVDVLEEIAKLKGRVSEVEETMNVVYGLSFGKVPDEVLRLPCADRFR